MKNQTKSNWQTIVFAVIATIVFMFAENSSASAQTTYKVGDRAEKMSAGKWVTVEIIKVEDGDQYVVRDVETGISGIWVYGKDLRSIKTDAQTNNQNNIGNQNQKDRNTPDENQTPVQNPAQTNKANRFGARDPRDCKDTKPPIQGAITAALALKYLNCQLEGISGGHLYLAENVQVEVGGGTSYAAVRGQVSLDQIDVRVPVYPIRGSFLRYQCDDLISEHVGPPDTNCTTYNNPKATGYCYKTTFGDWKCNMADRSSREKENVRTKVAPPKP